MQNLLEKSVIRGAGSDIQTVNYDYNYFGQRISKKNGLEEVRYLTDITRDHYNLLSQSINGKTMTFTYDDNVVSFEREGTRNYYQLDELGSTVYLTGTDGAAYSPKAYDPFGNILNPLTGERNGGRPGYTKEGNLIQPFAFTGYREEETGLYYAQARSYDPLSGRFTGEDKVRGLVALPDSYNRYIYCFNSPVVFVDNNGLFPTILVGAIAGAVINTVAYTVGAVVSGEEITAAGLASSAASGAVVGGLMGAGVTSPAILGAAGGAASGLVNGAMSGQTGKELLATTAKGAVVGGFMGATMASFGPAATIAAGAGIGAGRELLNQVTDGKKGVDWVSVGRHGLGGAAESTVAVVGYGALGKGLAGKTKSPVGQKTEAMYKNASARVKTAYNNGVNAVKDAWNNMARMFGPAEYMVTPEGFVVRVQYENGTNYSKSSGKSGGKGTKTSDTKNTNGNSGVKQSGSSNKKGQTKVTVDGKEVILDNDTFDPSQVDAQGRTNTQRMEQGLAPIGKDGKSVNIHHVDQTDTGPVKEILATKHQQNYKELHSNTGQEPSQIDRPAFNKWRKNSYWPWHAKNLNQ